MRQALSIAIGADHDGFDLKRQLVALLAAGGHTVRDCGTDGRDAADGPAGVAAVARLVASGACQFGICVDGAGIEPAILANRVPGVRAAACYGEALARISRERHDANVLTLGAGQSSLEQARAIVEIFLSSACTVAGHGRRAALSGDLERQGAPASARGDRPPSAEALASGAGRVRPPFREAGPTDGPAAQAVLPIDRLVALIDHTLLRPDATPADIERLCAEARQHRFFSVCVNPVWVRRAASLLSGADVKVCCVVGFPLGAHPPENKAFETRRAIRDGAREIDTVIHIGALKGRDHAAGLADIRAVVEACLDGHALCKVILETALLTDEEKVRGCELVMQAGAEFVKTSTGFGPGGATVADVALLSRTVAPKRLGVKAAGGVRSYADLLKMVEAGATRVGSSSSVAIVDEAKARGGR